MGEALGEGRLPLIPGTSPCSQKSAVPDPILLKPAKLTDEEFVVMHTHSKAGAGIFGSNLSELMQAAKKIAFSHHERWDATGYPADLVGDRIPLNARTLTVAEASDAMTTDRPYRRARTQPEAVHELETMSGTHFDVTIVQAFVRYLRRH
jgi:putative two-component system response regulator